MPKTTNYYPGETAKCQTARIGLNDVWCVHHAAYLLDCLHCGRNFHTDRPHTKYCSDACKQRAYRQRKNKS